ncbi:hypothetical protein [Pleionea litopenaei]|uniref:B box-type domain-containing protein n=1 Tax=Pleionea litopenaei TaxID=3070815 RepID=A0AA51RVQ2_9GAMM|nr:hypothetical protein [Pleionea sp. HL-JVS1]WMS88516.1 hypothetical protein Q9312_06260 [Pleionea sp. HL-JVS1]
MDCKYHPSVNATWYCSKCDVAFCVDCVPSTEQGSFVRCSLCRTYLEPLGISQSVTPFWLNLGQFFLYPLNLPMMLLVFGLSLVYSMFIVSFGLSLVSLLLHLVWFAIVYRISFSIMELSAHGEQKFSHLGKLLATRNGWSYIKLLCATALIGFLVYKALMWSLILGVLLTLLFIFAYPAVNIILCVDRSLFSAANPFRMIEVIYSIGWSYAIVFIFVVLFSLSTSFSMDLMTSIFPGKLAILMTNMFFLYFTFTMYKMLGYVVFQYHYELGFSVNRSQINQNVKTHGKSSATKSSGSEASVVGKNGIIEAQVFIQEGRYEDAEQVLRQALSAEPKNNQIYELLYKLFALVGKHDLMVKLCEKQLPLLVEQKAKNLIKISYFKVLEYNPEYFPSDPKVIDYLITCMDRKDEVKQAYRLFRFLKEHHIDYPSMASLSFYLAKLFAEKLNRRSDAAKLISWGINLADGDLKTSMKQYLSHLS